jgi:hypothetical protein
MELLTAVTRVIAMMVTAILMTAVQRQAVRLALERDPRLARHQGQREPRGASWRCGRPTAVGDRQCHDPLDDA